MKKYFILTSVLVLAACGGGSGGSGYVSSVNSVGSARTSATTGLGAIFVMQENPTVDDNNKSLTGMASYTVGTPADTEKLIAYVSSKLGSNIYSQESYDSLLRHSTTDRKYARTATDSSENNSLSDTKKKEIALIKISQMKSVLYNMVNTADDPEKLSNFVNKNRDSIKEALVLFGSLDKNTDISQMSATDVCGLFKKDDISITKENVMKEFEDFDKDEFGFTKETLANVIFESAGEDAKFQFKMDDTGKITNVALVEDPSSEYKHDDNKKYQYNNTTLERVTRNDTYRVSKQGWFDRDKTTTNFNTKYYEYEINLGNHNVDGAGQRSDLQTFKFYSVDGGLTGDALKQAAIEALLEFGDKLYTNQGGETDKDRANNRTKVTSVIQYYAGVISNLDQDFSVEPTEISAMATLAGFGASKGLKYSDFGYATLIEKVGDKSSTMYAPYAGGYETRRMKQFDNDGNQILNNSLNGAEFNGTVIAAIENTKNGTKNENDMLVTGNGKLTYSINDNVATNTLVVTGLKDKKNHDWYDVTISQGAENTSFKFNGTGKSIPEDYQFFTAVENITGAGTENESHEMVTTAGNENIKTDGSAAFTLGTSVPDNYRVEGGMDAQYYGADANNPTEATTRFGFSEEWHNKDNSLSNEVAIYGAFGGKKR